MDIRDFLYHESVVKIKASGFEKGYIGNSIIKFDEKFDLEEIQVVIIGVPETRNSFPKAQKCDTINIRKHLYSFCDFKNLKVADLGDLILGTTIADTYAALAELTKYLIEKNIFIIYIGGTQELIIPIIQELQQKVTIPEISIIDALIDHNSDSDFHSKSYLNHDAIFQNQKLIKSLIGYQTYFSSFDKVRKLTDASFNLYRLGAIRNNFKFIEPILRDSDLLSFDMSAIRQSDCPGASFHSPNGLYAEEACQLANMAGLSDKLSIFSIAELNQIDDINGQSAHLMSQIIWHLLMGISSRQGDYPIKSVDTYKKIYVKTGKMKDNLVFYQNEDNNRFWMELPGFKDNKKEVVACSEIDYKSICMNEIPDRLWKRISNTMK